MIRSSVDLPPPLGPSSAVSWPVGRSTMMSSSATKSPNFLVTPVTLISYMSLSLLLRAEDRHDDQAGHGGEGEQGGECVRRLLLEVLVGLLDGEGGRLGLADDVAGDDLDRAELTERAGQAEHDAVDDGPLDAGQRDPPERLHRVGAEAPGGLLLVVADLLEHRHHLADHQRQRHEHGRHDHAGGGEDDLEAGLLQARAEPSVAAVVDQHQGQADHDRRDRERYVEHRGQHPLAGEVVADQQDRDGQAEHQVDQPPPRR